MKCKRVLGMLLSILMIAGSIGCNKADEPVDITTVEPSKVGMDGNSAKGQFGDYVVEIKSARVPEFINWERNMVIDIDFTNNSDKEISFAECFKTYGFQGEMRLMNGVENTFYDVNDFNRVYDKVKPSETYTVQVLYRVLDGEEEIGVIGRPLEYYKEPITIVIEGIGGWMNGSISQGIEPVAIKNFILPYTDPEEKESWESNGNKRLNGFDVNIKSARLEKDSVTGAWYVRVTYDIKNVLGNFVGKAANYDMATLSKVRQGNVFCMAQPVDRDDPEERANQVKVPLGESVTISRRYLLNNTKDPIIVRVGGEYDYMSTGKPKAAERIYIIKHKSE